jgi:hypothetical protein
VLNEFADRHPRRRYSHVSKVDLSDEARNSLPGRRLGLELPHCADLDPSIDSTSVMPPVSIPKLPNIRTATPAAFKQTSQLHEFLLAHEVL